MVEMHVNAGNWDYSPVEPYSAPLTASAIANQDKKKHFEFVDIAREALRFKMTEHPNGEFEGFTFKDEAVSYEKKLTESPYYYDLCYNDTNIIVLCDAKVNRRDLNDKHTVAQLRAYADELALPCNAHKDKYLAICTPENLGGIARTIVEEKVLPFVSDSIKVLYISEYMGKSIPAPDGWDKNDFSEEHKTFWSSRRYGNVAVTGRWVKTADLNFDPANSRLIGVEDELMTQSECYRKLLADGDCADTDAALARRPQMLIGAIREPVWITSDMTVLVGNSRTAYSKYALEITNHHAPGYEMTYVYDFGDADPNMLYDLKQEEQAMTKLDQGRIHDAIDMWRRHTQRGQSIEELYEHIYNRKYSMPVIERSINTVQWLMDHGYKDNQSVMEMYYPAYKLECVQWSKVNKKFINAGITRAALTATAAKAADPKWRSMKGMDNLAKALQDSLAPDWKITALKNFIVQKETKKEKWAKVCDWEKSYKELSEKNRYSANLAARQLSTAETSVENTVREVKFTISQLKAGSPKKGEQGLVYSSNDIKKLQQRAHSLLDQVEILKNLLGDAVFEYSKIQ